MRRYDHIEIRVDAEQHVKGEHGGYQPIEIYINDRSLIEIMREVETPFAQQELEERLQSGEDPEGCTCWLKNMPGFLLKKSY